MSDQPQEAAANRAADTLLKREKTWDELPQEEQIERLRRQVSFMRDELQWLRNAMTKMQVHEHSKGEIVIPISRHDYGEVLNGNRMYDPLR